MKTSACVVVVWCAGALASWGSEPWIQDAGGGFIFNHGAILPSAAGLTFTNQGVRDVTVSAGQLSGVCPETGIVITNRLDLLPLRAQSVESEGDVVASGVFYGDAAGLWNIPAAGLVGSIPANVLPQGWGALPQDLAPESVVVFYEMHVGHDIPHTVTVSGVADAANGVYQFRQMLSGDHPYYDKDRDKGLHNWISGWSYEGTTYWDLHTEAGYNYQATAPSEQILPPQTGWSDPNLVVTYGPARFTVIDGGKVEARELVADRITLGGESISDWSEYHGDQSVNTTDDVQFHSIQFSRALPEGMVPIMIRVHGWTGNVADANDEYIRGDDSYDRWFGQKPSTLNGRPVWYYRDLGGCMTRIFFNGAAWEHSGITGYSSIKALAPDSPLPPTSGWTVIEGTGSPVLDFFGTRIDEQIIQSPQGAFESGRFGSLTLNGWKIDRWSEFARGDQSVRTSDAVLFADLSVSSEIPQTIIISGWTHPVEVNSVWTLGDDSPNRPSRVNGKPAWYHPSHDNWSACARVFAGAGGRWQMSCFVYQGSFSASASAASFFPPETGWTVSEGSGQPAVSFGQEALTRIRGQSIVSGEGLFDKITLSGQSISNWSEIGGGSGADQPLNTTSDVTFASVTADIYYILPRGDLSMGSFTNGVPHQ